DPRRGHAQRREARAGHTVAGHALPRGGAGAAAGAQPSPGRTGTGALGRPRPAGCAGTGPSAGRGRPPRRGRRGVRGGSMDAMVNSAEDPADAADAGGAPVRVLLVDDEALMRAGLRLMIDGAHGIEVIGEAGDGGVALEQVRALAPDVVLMDIRMPAMTGLEALRALQRSGSAARVVMLTAFDTDDFLLEALRAGAVSFLLKDSPPEEVVQAVLDAAADRPRFSPDVLSRLVRPASTGAPGISAAGAAGRAAAAAAGEPAGEAASGPAAAVPAPEGITGREWEVARLVAAGLTNQEIGERLFMSVATVKTHLGRLYHKLQVTNRVQLAIRVLELGGGARLGVAVPKVSAPLPSPARHAAAARQLTSTRPCCSTRQTSSQTASMSPWL